MNKTETFEPLDYKPESGKLILYGAGVYGEYAFRALKKLGITVDFFCDRSKFGSDLFGVPVISPEEIKKYKDDAYVIICASARFREIEIFLKKEGFNKYYNMLSLFEVVSPDEIEKYHAMTYYDNTFLRDQYIMDMNEESSVTDEILVTTVTLHITERCTLNCRDCAEMMPYYKNPKDLNIDELIASLERFLACVEQLPVAAIQGGETFMHRELYRLVEYCCENPKIKQVSLTTNGTIVPFGQNLSCLHHPKAVVRINEYGEFSKNIPKLEETFKQTGVRYSIEYSKDALWSSIGGLEKRKYSEEQLRAVFNGCIFKNDIGIMNGRLSRCVRSRNGIALSAIPDCKWEYLDLLADVPLEELKNQIKKLLKLPYLNSCYYCDSPLFMDTEVERAVQAKGILPYIITNEVIEDALF